MASIKYDNTELLNTTYIPRFVKHETATERFLVKLDLAKEDGSVLIDDRRGTKIISIQGILTDTTQASLETKIDSFKELFARQQKELSISWESSARKYIATCISHKFDRDYFNNLYVPWTAEFEVLSGVGLDAQETVERTNESITTNPYNFSPTLGGSAIPKPIVKITFSSNHTNPRGIMIKHRTTGEKIIFNQIAPFYNDDYVQFDFANKVVKLNGNEKPFLGLFPPTIVGTNYLQLEIGELLDQYADMYWAWGSQTGPQMYGNNWSAMGFTVPYKDSTYRKLQIFCYKIGNPPNDLIVRIETDNNGKPSGNLVSAYATGAITANSCGSGSQNADWEDAIFNGLVTLEPNTRYWIVLKTTDGDASNCYGTQWLRLGIDANFNYYKGNSQLSSNAGSSWTDYGDAHIGFKLYYGGLKESISAKLDVRYTKRYL